MGDEKLVAYTNGTAPSSLLEERKFTAVEYLSSPSPRRLSPKRQEKRKLVLHFDVRNTILVADSVTKIPIEARLNSYLTTVAWGHEDEDSGNWVWDSTDTSLVCPVSGAMPYYKYLEGKYVNLPEDRGLLRDITGKFTDEAIGAPFKDAFDEYLKLLEWTHEDKDPQLTRQGKSEKYYHYFLPSFFNLVDFLVNTNRDFSVNFRTFGMDATNAIKTMQYFMQGKHPAHKELHSLREHPVNVIPGSVKRTNDGEIHFQKVDLDTAKEKKYHTEREIYNMLSTSRGFQAFKDDFIYWQDHDYHYTAGKPVWIDPWDVEVHHIFFDDHVRLSEKDNIVDLRLFEPGADVARTVTPRDLHDLRDVCVVQLDLLHAIRDGNYFINKLKTCESSFMRLVSSSSSSSDSSLM